MHTTGNTVLDQFFQYTSGLNLVYGAPATGKTTLCLQAANHYAEKGRVIFLDTENSFSLDRIKLMNPEVKLDNIFVMKIKHFEDQMNAVKRLQDLDDISLIIIDSLSAYYRKALQDNQNVNPLFSKQLSELKELSRKGTPILLTAQVYSKMDGNYEVVGKNMVRNWSDVIIQLLKTENRALKLEKHPDKSDFLINFKINQTGLSF